MCLQYTDMDKTLALPLVAMGNVPQIAIQLAVDFRKDQLAKTTIYSTYQYPFVGPDLSVGEASNRVIGKRKDLARPLHLYRGHGGTSEPRVDYLQLHSPIIPGCESLFIKELVKLIEHEQYTKIMVFDAKDRGLWHGENATLVEERVLHWGNQTLSGLHLDDDDDHDVADTRRGKGGDSEELPSVNDTNPFVRFLVNMLPETEIDYYAVSVYDGWNMDAAYALLDAARLPVERVAERDAFEPTPGVYV